MEEVVAVLLCLETDQVRTKQTVKQGIPRVQTAKDLGGWESCMKEEPYLCMGQSLPQ